MSDWTEVPFRERAGPRVGRRLFIAAPSYDGWTREENREGLRRPSESAEKWTVIPGRGSLLAYVFNRLWLSAYNSRAEHGWTHFAMHHADVEAPPGWADVLMDEMDAHQADVLSACVAIKDGRGLTSTGLAHPENGSIRRLTWHEVHRLPETFDGPAACRVLGAPEGSGLAVNTGLMLVNFDTVSKFIPPGSRGEKDPGLFFSVLDGIREEAGGNLTACVLPEDWNFSRSCRERGLSVMATRKVPVAHHGEGRYPSGVDGGPWGDWLTDAGDKGD